MLPVAITPAPEPEPSPPPATAAELKLTVEINGSAATPDSSGRYVVLPGQLVAVKTSEGDSVSWVGGMDSANVRRTDVDTSSKQWVSRFDNIGLGATSYKLVASASEGRTKELNFWVQTGDYRNGDYIVFAANGSRQTLNMDFNKFTYTVTDASGNASSGTMTPGVSPTSDWLVQSDRITGVPAAALRLRGLRDNVVGALPFSVPYAGSPTYGAFPFVASRALLITQSKLDGTYDRARIEVSAAGGESAIAQIQISGGGTIMKQCVDPVIYRIENCPAANVVTSNIEADTQPGMWLLKNQTTGALLGRFGIADVEGDKTYLSAGTSPANGNQVFAIGVPAAQGYEDFISTGWSTKGTIDLSKVAASTYTVSMSLPGSGTSADLALSAGPATSPAGIRAAVVGSDVYFAMRSKRLEVLIGARSPSPKAGFLHLGIIY
ncbi:hypothetical protein [Variovorax boronicumulans]|uniref:hypothetical protein n=1 Tax=Variovorax boronicumulans TaxID=436515 RepID=UPI001576BD9F|nr:hypothetical protein [Variovorax boronicumulans]